MTRQNAEHGRTAESGTPLGDWFRRTPESLRMLAEETEALRSAESDAPVHACPPKGSGVMPCCGRTPFEVPDTDRMTLDPALVTCVTPPERTDR